MPWDCTMPKTASLQIDHGIPRFRKTSETAFTETRSATRRADDLMHSH